MAFRGSFLLLTIGLIAFSGAKLTLAQEHETQQEIQRKGRNTSLLSMDEPNKRINATKESAEGIHAVDESLIHNLGSQDSSGKKIAGDANDIKRKTETGHQIISPESHWNHDHISGRGGAHTYSQPPEVTAMLAGIFVAFAVIGYFGLVCWRRALEKKYGNREMLVEEEEFNTDD